MTKEAALKSFFSGFRWNAYPNTAVPANAELPYITYSTVTDSFFGGPVSLTVQLWDYTSQESPINAKVREISERIGPGGVVLPCEGGNIWLQRGSPFSTSSNGENDENMKMRQLNITALFHTFD